MPVAEHYEAQGLCARISAVPPPNDVFTEACLRMSMHLLCRSGDIAMPVRSMVTGSEVPACTFCCGRGMNRLVLPSRSETLQAWCLRPW